MVYYLAHCLYIGNMKLHRKMFMHSFLLPQTNLPWKKREPHGCLVCIQCAAYSMHDTTMKIGGRYESNKNVLITLKLSFGLSK